MRLREYIYIHTLWCTTEMLMTKFSRIGDDSFGALQAVMTPSSNLSLLEHFSRPDTGMHVSMG